MASNLGVAKGNRPPILDWVMPVRARSRMNTSCNNYSNFLQVQLNQKAHQSKSVLATLQLGGLGFPTKRTVFGRLYCRLQGKLLTSGVQGCLESECGQVQTAPRSTRSGTPSLRICGSSQKSGWRPVEAVSGSPKTTLSTSSTAARAEATLRSVHPYRAFRVMMIGPAELGALRGHCRSLFLCLFPGLLATEPFSSWTAFVREAAVVPVVATSSVRRGFKSRGFCYMS